MPGAEKQHKSQCQTCLLHISLCAARSRQLGAHLCMFCGAACPAVPCRIPQSLSAATQQQLEFQFSWGAELACALAGQRHLRTPAPNCGGWVDARYCPPQLLSAPKLDCTIVSMVLRCSISNVCRKNAESWVSGMALTHFSPRRPPAHPPTHPHPPHYCILFC